MLESTSASVAVGGLVTHRGGRMASQEERWEAAEAPERE